MDRLKSAWKIFRNEFTKNIVVAEDIKVIYLLAFFTALAFGHSFFYDFFIFDDAVFVLTSPHVKDVGFLSFFKVWMGTRTPVVYNIWQVISAFFGVESAFPYRLINIIFHVINSFGLFVLARELIKRIYPKWEENKKQLNFALVVGALFFLVHPVQAESVIWISSFKGTLAATFGILSVLFYLSSRDKQEEPEHLYLFIGLSFTCYMLGLLCKPSIVTIPILYIALDVFLFRIKGAKLAVYNFCYFVSILLISLIHMINPAQSVGVIEPGLRDKAVLMLETFRFSVIKIIFPFKYSFDYQLTPDKLMDMFQGNLIGLGWALVVFYLIFSIIILYLWQKKHNLTLCGVLIVTTMYIVNSGLISFAFQNISTVANRYQYLPLLGFAIIVVALVYRGLLWKPKATKIITLSLLVLLGIRGIHEGKKWRTSEELLTDSYLNHRNSYPLNIALGSLAFEKGNFKEAERYYEAAYKATDGEFYTESYTKLLEVYGINRELEKGRKMIDKVMSILSDRSGEVEIAILRYYYQTDQFLQARDFIPRAEHFTKKNPSRAYEVKVIKKNLNDLFINTNQETYRQIGIAYYKKENYPLALVWIQKALEMHPEEKLDKFKRYLEHKIKEEGKVMTPMMPLPKM